MPISQPFGYGSPVNLTGTRNLATQYTATRNTFVSVNINGGAGAAVAFGTVNGNRVFETQYSSPTGGYEATVVFPVRAGETYQVDGAIKVSWWESYA